MATSPGSKDSPESTSSRHPVRLLELAHRLRLRQLFPVLLREREAARLHHPADEVVGLGQSLGR